MDFSVTLLNLAGAVALLLWGVHMVQTGVQRAFGARLRSFLSNALRNRLKAFLAGMGVTAILQSSTATGLMITGFAAGGSSSFCRLSPSCSAPSSRPSAITILRHSRCLVSSASGAGRRTGSEKSAVKPLASRSALPSLTEKRQPFTEAARPAAHADSLC